MSRLCGRRPILTAEQQQKLQEWAAVGTSIVSVARRYGIAPNTLRRYIRGKVKTYQQRTANP